MGKKVNLSDYNKEELPSAEEMRFGIIVAEWNSEITEALYEGAYNTLIENGASPEDIIRKNVPGSFELSLGARLMADTFDIDAIIVIGAVIRGETPHFDYVCQSVTQGITRLNLDYGIPFIFCVLTTDNFEQAKDRAGGKHGNKGVEAAIAAIKMVEYQYSIEDELYERLADLENDFEDIDDLFEEDDDEEF